MKILRRDVRVRESISTSRGAERCKNGREQKSKSRDLELRDKFTTVLLTAPGL